MVLRFGIANSQVSGHRVDVFRRLTLEPMGRFGMSSNGPGPAKVGRSTARTSRERWLVALGGVLAGLIAFGTGEAVYQRFRPALVRQDLMGNKIMAPTLETKHAAVVKNSALTFGVLGACLGICLGAAGGLARGSTRAAVIGGSVGAVLGSAAGAGLTLAVLPGFLVAGMDYFEYDLIIAMAMHGLIWGVLGAAAGLAFAVGEGDWRLIGRAVTAGGLGGLVGAITFELIGGMYFAAAETSDAISLTWQTRLMARLLVSLGTAAAIVLCLPSPPRDVVEYQTELAASPPES